MRIGLIGAGSRGREIFRAALRCPNVEAVAAADVYTRCLEEAKAIAPQLTRTRTLDGCSTTSPLMRS